MTIQEAIEWMIIERSTIVECDEPNNASKTIIKAFDMAIDALEHVAEEQRAIKEFENVNPFGEWSDVDE